MTSTDQRQNILDLMDKNAKIREIYNNRPFKEEYDQLEKRLIDMGSKIVTKTNKPTQISVSEEDFKLIWKEVNACRKLWGDPELPYSDQAVYSLLGLFIVKLEDFSKRAVTEATRIVTHYRKLLKFQSTALIKDCCLFDLDNSIKSLETAEWGMEMHNMHSSIKFLKEVKEIIIKS